MEKIVLSMMIKEEDEMYLFIKGQDFSEKIKIENNESEHSSLKKYFSDDFSVEFLKILNGDSLFKITNIKV